MITPDFGEFLQLALAQTSCKRSTRIVLHSPEALEGINTYDARPYILIKNDIERDVLAYIATRVDLSDPELAKEQLTKLQRTAKGKLAEKLLKFTPEKLYELSKPPKVDAIAGIMFQDVFDVYLALEGKKRQIDGLSLSLDLSLDADEKALNDEIWLHATAPLAYAAQKMPGLKFLDSLQQARTIQPIKEILEAARKMHIDYEHYHELKL